MENVVKTLVKTPDGKLVVEDVECIPLSDTKFDSNSEENEDDKK